MRTFGICTCIVGLALCCSMPGRAANVPAAGDLTPYSYFRVTHRGLGPWDVVPFSTYDIELLRKLSAEFSNELTMLGADADQQQRNLSVLGERVQVREHLGDAVSRTDPAYEQLETLSERGLPIRWVGTGLSGERALTRFELALATRYAAASATRKYTDEPVTIGPELYRPGHSTDVFRLEREVGIRRHNLEAIVKLAHEFDPELRLLDVDLTAQRDALERCLRLNIRAESELARHPVVGSGTVPVK